MTVSADQPSNKWLERLRYALQYDYTYTEALDLSIIRRWATDTEKLYLRNDIC
jgi:hypothetical protein